MKSKKFSLITIMVLIVISVTGCRETPKKEVISNRANGLAKESLAEPLPGDATRKLEIPSKWEQSYDMLNNKVKINVDVTLDDSPSGNLPVLEMKQKALHETELKKLIEFFMGKGKLYVAPSLTKDEILSWQQNLENLDGKYGSPFFMSSRKAEQLDKLNQLLETASDEAEYQGIKPEFTNYKEDNYTFITKRTTDPEVNSSEKCYFHAVIQDGDTRASILATSKNDEAGVTSTFAYNKGTFFSESDIELRRWYDESGKREFPDNEWLDSDEEMLDTMEEKMNGTTFPEEKAKACAKRALDELNIIDLDFGKAEKAIYYPKLNADRYNEKLEDAHVGYLLTYYRNINGFSAYSTRGSAENVPELTYIPPFEQEKIEIIVTEEGLQMLEWTNMTDVVSVIAENTNLLSFEDIKDKITNHLAYGVIGEINSSPDMTAEYEIVDVKLCYGYATAYENPKNAWLIPVWVVTAKSTYYQNGVFSTDNVYVDEMFSALDGGYIVPLNYMTLK